MTMVLEDDVDIGGQEIVVLPVPSVSPAGLTSMPAT
jgi:hypothetical protein